jgi:hypothetical protein
VRDIGHLYEELIGGSRAIVETARRVTRTQPLSPP